MSLLDTANRDVLEQIMGFPECEPHMCVWCRDCGIVLCDDLWGYVCLRAGNHRDLNKRMKNVITPFPVNTEGTRTGIQCVNADERHECFRPTQITDRRLYMLDALGLLGSADESSKPSETVRQVKVIDNECLTCELFAECKGNVDECEIAGVECNQSDCISNRDGYCYALRLQIQDQECMTYRCRDIDYDEEEE